MTKYKNYHYIPEFNAYWFGAAERRADDYWRKFHAERERHTERDQEKSTARQGEKK